MISSILIANRGEIAIRIARTLRSIGIRSVGIHTLADNGSLHLKECDHVEEVGTSYLDIQAIIAAARRSGAEAVHPGYGFLSENADLARACRDAGLIFIGPSAEAIALMGSKSSAREVALKHGVPVLAGSTGADEAALLAAAAEVGFPLLIKPAAGGGGKGLHRAMNIEQMPELLAVARREARSAFGDDELLIERYLARPRHIEFQVLGDSHGRVIHLGERECTLQRRHQKVIEEAPSSLLTPQLREEMGTAAVKLAAAIGYTNAGTVEFLVDADAPDHFYFIEMNTRLQVEHRVTELIHGIDLVQLQIALADGGSLDDLLPHPSANGHSIQARVYAEDPYNDFLPTGGPVLEYQPSTLALVDSAIARGSYISSSYDPMLAKIIVHSPSREDAIRELRAALDESVIFGLTTNIDYLRQLLDQPDVIAGEFDTGFIATHPPQRTLPGAETRSAYALALQAGDGWRLNAPANPEVIGYVESQRLVASIDPDAPASSVTTLVDADGVWVHHPVEGTFHILRRNPVPRSGKVGSQVATAPMPGTVIQVLVAPGDEVREGDALVVVEAMKMEHVLRAMHSGVVESVWVESGARVAARAPLVKVVAHG